MARVTKLTISLPQSLVSIADEVAREQAVSRSRIIAACLEELAERRRVAKLEEGYRVMAETNRSFAEDAVRISHGVLPGWESEDARQ